MKNTTFCVGFSFETLVVVGIIELVNKQMPALEGNRVKITDCAATVISSSYEGRCWKSPTTSRAKRLIPEQEMHIYTRVYFSIPLGCPEEFFNDKANT